MSGVRSIMASVNEDAMMLDPPSQFDKCVIGYASRCGMDPVAVYDAELVIQALMDDGMSEEDAQEWFSFNIEGAYMGKGTPMYLTRIDASAMDVEHVPSDDTEGGDL